MPIRLDDKEVDVNYEELWMIFTVRLEQAGWGDRGENEEIRKVYISSEYCSVR